ncbi:hypothetical protein [Photobacterium halotolerans]|uniref:FlgD Ig-like domain-containing protein n=1 Tax=Photobacterium halotolerans TaxID=265726 RepID=A0A0F5VAC6_9GAMM|nr:hypothetical protein [Photobacterium halotolerans]KKC99110.1 hypothetical protein KY46_14825 [Photobacterium halotolerans]
MKIVESRYAWLMIVMMTVFPWFAQADSHPFVIESFTSHTFDIARDQQFPIMIRVAEATELQVDIVSPDGDLVKTLYPMQSTAAGVLKLSWNGTDMRNQPVPNEAWLPVIRYRQSGTLISVSPQDSSGGEVIEHVPLTIESAHRLKINLDTPARVLMRAGIQSGAMLRTIVNWQPKAAGAHVIQWNGRDTSDVFPFTGLENFAVMATAYQLPDNSIITWRNEAKSYTHWRQSLGYPEQSADQRASIQETRNGQLLSKVFFKPKYLPLDPRVQLRLKQHPESQLATVEVDIPQQDRGLVEESLYEVGFFIDGEFVSEEEQGYVPFTWQFKPSNYSKGVHYLTVNITGFDGQVGVSSVKFVNE